jgi:DNA-binding ferritin-like protein
MKSDKKLATTAQDEGQGPDLATKGRKKFTEVAERAGTLAGQAQEKVAELAQKGNHRILEAVLSAGNKAKEVFTGLFHSAQEAAQKVVHGAQEATIAGDHRHEAHQSSASRKTKRAASAAKPKHGGK